MSLSAELPATPSTECRGDRSGGVADRWMTACAARRQLVLGRGVEPKPTESPRSYKDYKRSTRAPASICSLVAELFVVAHSRSPGSWWTT
jgi:hypothetical protein